MRPRWPGLLLCGVLWTAICVHFPTMAQADDLDDIIASESRLPDAPTVKTAEETCRMIGNKLGSVGTLECLRSGLVASGGVSVEGTPILFKEYPPLPARQPQARVLLIGGIHGDEYSSVSVIFKWMKVLDRYHSGLFHWRIAPLTNPDGLLREKSQRTNARGVDLNRNFPTRNWENESEDYWVRKTHRDARRYPGPKPLSEPESRWIHDQIRAFQPNVIVSVHAPFGLLDFDGAPTVPPKKLGHLYLSVLGTYPGSLGRFAGILEGVPVVTIELSYAGIMPTRTQTSRIWTDLVHWMRHNVEDHDGPSRLPSQPPKPRSR
ncbi:MAG: murein peptide amidase A [Magnetococcales bacterium]|nr:murein peptide amidase A [Magnetococcales bacterium]